MNIHVFSILFNIQFYLSPNTMNVEKIAQHALEFLV